MVNIDDEVEVKILKIDRERERIALGMKQKEASPWENIEATSTRSGARVTGEVVNLMSYGAFVKLEDGVEGLVHISEMSWTKRVNHPSEVVNVGDQVEVVVLEVNPEKQEISLGMKQTEVNPWDMVSDNYPPGTVIRGRVRNLTNYGAFIELQEGIDGLLHITDMSWTKKITHPSEVVKKGEEIECVVLSVDQEKKRIALGLKQLQPGSVVERHPGALPHRRQRSRHRHEDHQLRRLRRARVGPRGPAAHLGAGGPQGREPGGCGQGRPKGRGARHQDRPEERKIGLTLIQASFATDEDEVETVGASATEDTSAPPTEHLSSLASQLKDIGARISGREEESSAAPAEEPAEEPAEPTAEPAADAAAPADSTGDPEDVGADTEKAT